MSDEQPNLSALIDQLPARLQNRFESIGNYVQGLTEELKIELKINRRLSNEEMRLIQFAAFVFSIDDFFRLGTRAARGAAQTFTRYNMPGFRVGSSNFTPDNDNTMRGQRIAERLNRSIRETELSRYLIQARSMRDLVQRLLEAMKNDI